MLYVLIFILDNVMVSSNLYCNDERTRQKLNDSSDLSLLYCLWQHESRSVPVPALQHHGSPQFLGGNSHISIKSLAGTEFLAILTEPLLPVESCCQCNHHRNVILVHDRSSYTDAAQQVLLQVALQYLQFVCKESRGPNPSSPIQQEYSLKVPFFSYWLCWLSRYALLLKVRVLQPRWSLQLARRV
jgi:hypothetical protein